jgi:hypothetical protein
MIQRGQLGATSSTEPVVSSSSVQVSARLPARS